MQPVGLMATWHVVVLVFFWMSTGWYCRCGTVDERQYLADIKELDSNQNVPALFKRTYKEWVEETKCINESLKSSEAEIKPKGPLRFSMKARIAARSGKPLLKVELWMEFYNASKVYPFNSYEAIIRPTDSRLQPTNQTSPRPIISDKGRLVELSFNVTDIYHSAKLLGKRHVHFRINIHGFPKKSAKELQGAIAIKAFLVIHEFEEICNEYFPVRRPGRYKRSHTKRSTREEQRLLMKSRRSRHVFNGHQLQKHPTLKTMVSMLYDIAGKNLSRPNHSQASPQHNLDKRLHLKSGRSQMTLKDNHPHYLQKPQEAINTMVSTHSNIVGMNLSRPNHSQISPQHNLDKRLHLKSEWSRMTLKDHLHHLQKPEEAISTLNDTVGRNLSGQNHLQRSPQHSLEQGVYLKSERSHGTFKDHHQLQKSQEAINTMMSTFSSIVGSNLSLQKHPHKRSSRPILKSLHPDSNSNTRTSCGLNDWYVSFDYIGWDAWVIAPSGVRARTCSGVCSFPMGSDINSTAHAHLQSFVYYFKGEKWPACCVPNDFEPLTMILYDITDQLPFIVKYPNMIATNCACL